MTMSVDRETLDLVAGSLEYPRPSTATCARRAAERAAGDHPALAHALWDLAGFLEGAEPGEPEERYTALFDLNPVCTLHVGYHLFGENYPRGALLAGLRAEMRRVGLDAAGDLPDFLPTILRLLARLEDEDRSLLLEHALLPGLARMGHELASSRTPWADVVRALPGVLKPAGLPEAVLIPSPAARGEEAPSHA